MTGVQLINPQNKQPLFQVGNNLADKDGHLFSLVNGVYRFVDSSGYSASFGYQWKKFKQIQLDKFSGQNITFNRFFTVTQWEKGALKNQDILEVGCGAGRFTQIVLDHTKANLYSLDYSDAAEANFENNGPNTRLKLFQASIYEMPFAENMFDKIFCFGVLQHTPDIKNSIESMYKLLKPGGELILDFYPYNGFWTKLNAKYLLRPFLKKMNHERLLTLIDKHADWMIALSSFFNKLKIGALINRFIPICDIPATLPKNLTPQERREWVKLDTFDMFSAQYDHPQKRETVEKYFQDLGMQNVVCKTILYNQNLKVTYCLGVK